MKVSIEVLEAAYRLGVATGEVDTAVAAARAALDGEWSPEDFAAEVMAPADRWIRARGPLEAAVGRAVSAVVAHWLQARSAVPATA